MGNEGFNKIGHAVDVESGETVMEVFGPPNALTEGADILSRLLYDFSEVIIRGITSDVPHGWLGGEFGYGPIFENDVFSMRPDYQDAKCTCGFSEQAEAWHEAHLHSPTCYHTEVYKIDFDDHEARRRCDEAIKRRDSLPWLSKEGNEVQKEVMYWSGQHRKWKDSVLKKLCKQHNIPWKDGYGCMVHCDCGQETLRNDFFEKNDHDPKCEMVLPNFCHKSSGFEARWYKWIGRDMATNRDITDEELRQIFTECWESIPQEIRDKAQAEHEFENTPEYLAERDKEMAALFESARSGYCGHEGRWFEAKEGEECTAGEARERQTDKPPGDDKPKNPSVQEKEMAAVKILDFMNNMGVAREDAFELMLTLVNLTFPGWTIKREEQ